MAKLFETSEDIVELAQEKFEETNLAQIGINLKIMSVSKAKNVLKVSKAGATVQYLTNKDVFLTVYEEAFDKLTYEMQQKLMEGALSNIAYDFEKDKLSVEGDIAKELFRMRKKYENYVDMMETSYAVIEQLEEEEKQKKEEEKMRKAAEKAAKKKNKG
jgi:hypothetical protein